MYHRFSTISRLGLIIILTLAAFVGCNSSDPVLPIEEDQPPALPAASTMNLDLSFFDSAQAGESSVINGAPAPELLAQFPTRHNFINAAVRVLVVHMVACAAVQPPVAAFVIAVHSVPQRQADGSWLWTYIIVDEEIEYSIYLRGNNVGEHTEWSMRVSSSDPEMPLDHFLWFDGEAMNDDSEGFWQFYLPEEAIVPAAARGAYDTSGVPFLRIDWHNLSNDTHRLTFLLNAEGHADEGDSIEFFTSNDICYLEHYDASKSATANITWYADGSGYILVPDYNNGEKACWDTQQYDVDCSE
ncbi:MAG: hypothetical protein ABIA59_00065 [Candidatus Latescibacterota bacterium]